ncbi:DUF6941 family protein [Methylobacter sp. sgz302048]|uniref:DUF6941 family protein n=1 Tax=Methylobacter sp. sgz302048 TaxID=3455945 RepID=UPI003F9ED6DA
MKSKKLPESVKFFIADDIRSEGTKPMIIGLFSDDTVGIEMPKSQMNPSKDAPIRLQQGIAILASFIDCEGPFETEVSLYQPNGTALFEHNKIDGGINSDKKRKKGSINFISKFVPFDIPEFGQYKYVIKLDDKEYEYKFKIERRNQ